MRLRLGVAEGFGNSMGMVIGVVCVCVPGGRLQKDEYRQYQNWWGLIARTV